MWRQLVLLVALAVSECGATPPWQISPPLKVLFIGNSYTYFHRLPDVVTAFSKAPESPRAVEVRMIAKGGASLLEHWEEGTARRAIRSGEWQVVILQEQSLLPLTRPEQLAIYAKRFAAEVKEAGGKTVLYLTWARKDLPAQQARLDDAYANAAKASGAGLALVGPAWAEVRKRLPDLSLHDVDGSHPAPLGTYLAACVIYLTVIAEAKACPALGDADRNDARMVALRDIALATVRPKP